MSANKFLNETEIQLPEELMEISGHDKSPAIFVVGAAKISTSAVFNFYIETLQEQALSLAEAKDIHQLCTAIGQVLYCITKYSNIIKHAKIYQCPRIEEIKET